MKLPDPFDGNPLNLKKFLLQCTLYLQMNKNIYDTNKWKIGFVILYMDQKAAATWAENYLINHIDHHGDFALVNYKSFLMDLNAHFKDVAAETNSLFTLERIKQAGKSIQEHNAEFDRHLTRANIEQAGNDEALIRNMYLRSLDEGLQQQVLQYKPTPHTLEETMKAALDENLQFRTFQHFQGLADWKKTTVTEEPKKRFFKYRSKEKDFNCKKFRTIWVAVNKSSNEEDNSKTDNEDSDVDLDIVNLKDVVTHKFVLLIN